VGAMLGSVPANTGELSKRRSTPWSTKLSSRGGLGKTLNCGIRCKALQSQSLTGIRRTIALRYADDCGDDALVERLNPTVRVGGQEGARTISWNEAKSETVECTCVSYSWRVYGMLMRHPV